VSDSFRAIEREVVSCRRCPRLVAWREEAARHPPRRFRGKRYWSRPLPAFGNPKAGILLVGLAPAAHGGNRTGRIFTGDESGNFLYRALHAAGFSNRPVSVRRGDGLTLSGALLSAACRCPPPANKPLPSELENCREYLERELSLMPRPRVLVALGAIAFRTCLLILQREGGPLPRPLPRFSHGARYGIGGDVLLASYHPSQQNTFTGKLTPPMLRSVLRRALREAEKLGSTSPRPSRSAARPAFRSDRPFGRSKRAPGRPSR
jgi:uracil-DNA glycosylase family 4